MEKNWLEWSVFGLSLIVLAFIFGFLGYDALTNEHDQNDIAIHLGNAEAHDGYYALPVSIENNGGQSVEDVEVEVTLLEGGRELETSSVTAPMLPRKSSRRAWVAFSTDPREADDLQARLVGYVLP